MTIEQALFIKKAFDKGYTIFLTKDDEYTKILHVYYDRYMCNTEDERLTILRYDSQSGVYENDMLIYIEWENIQIFKQKNRETLHDKMGSYTMDFVKTHAG